MIAASTCRRAETTLARTCLIAWGCLALLGGGAAGAAPPPDCPDAGLAATDGHAGSAETAVICEVNRYRAAHGAPALRAAPGLARSAARFAQRLVDAGRLDHYLDGTTPRSRARTARYARWRSIDFEDLGVGQTTAAEVVGAWVASPPHNAVLLAPARHVGAGFVSGYWVLDLDRR